MFFTMFCTFDAHPRARGAGDFIDGEAFFRLTLANRRTRRHLAGKRWLPEKRPIANFRTSFSTRHHAHFRVSGGPSLGGG